MSEHLIFGPSATSTCGCRTPEQHGEWWKPLSAPTGPQAVLREALERLLAVALTEEEDVSPATQDEWIAAIKQAQEALDG